VSRRRVAIVPHTHWDREWYAPFQTFRLRLVELLDDLLPMLERDLDFGHYLLDGQVALVDDYLDVRPSAAARLRRLVGSGRVAIGPWYTLPDEFCVSGETLVRDLQLGLSRAASFGGAMEVGYLPDMFGHIAQMPQLLRLFGFEHAVVWRGVPGAIDRTAFWWAAPDGSVVRAEYLWHGYGNGAAVPDDAKALVRRVEALFDELGPALVGNLLLMNGADHQPPQPWLGRVVAEANTTSADLELTVSSLGSALEASATSATTTGGPVALPRWTGELRSGARANLLMGVASNRVDVKQAAARAERALERQAEPLCALWLAPEAWPETLFEAAWLEMARNAAHDSSCACSIDDVGKAVLHRYAEATHIADGLRAQALAALASTQAVAGAIVANPAARTRGGVVEVVVGGTEPLVGGQLLEHRPTAITDRLMTQGDAWSWLLWFRSQRIDDHTYVNRAEVAADGEAVSLTLHCDGRPLDNFIIEDVKADVKARLSARPGAKLHLRILEPPSQRTLWHVREVPGFGWRRWSAVPSPAAPVRPVEGSAGLSNGLIRVNVDAHDGTFAIDGLDGLGRLIDSGDHGDTYNYSPPEHDTRSDQPASVRVTVDETGPVRGRLRVTTTYEWPERVDDGAHARVGRVPVQVTTVLELRADEPWVRVTHEWVNLCRDHRLRTLLPLPERALSSQAECAFAVVARPLHAEGGPTERALATSFSRRFVRAGGLTVVHDGLLEYELTGPGGDSLTRSDTHASALALTLLRATGMISRPETTYRPLPAGPPLPTPGAQLQGRRTASYAVCVDPGIDPYAMADDVLVPLEVVVAGGGGSQTTAHGQGLSVEGAQVSALLRQHGGQLTLRVFNPKTDPSVLRLAGQTGWVVDLRGRPQASFAETLELAPAQIATLRLRS
jgi:mannosylglycerate hydrolase